MQIVMAMDVDQRTELQAMIYDLEEENRSRHLCVSQSQTSVVLSREFFVFALCLFGLFSFLAFPSVL